MNHQAHGRSAGGDNPEGMLSAATSHAAAAASVSNIYGVCTECSDPDNARVNLSPQHEQNMEVSWSGRIISIRFPPDVVDALVKKNLRLQRNANILQHCRDCGSLVRPLRQSRDSNSYCQISSAVLLEERAVAGVCDCPPDKRLRVFSPDDLEFGWQLRHRYEEKTQSERIRTLNSFHKLTRMKTYTCEQCGDATVTVWEPFADMACLKCNGFSHFQTPALCEMTKQVSLAAEARDPNRLLGNIINFGSGVTQLMTSVSLLSVGRFLWTYRQAWYNCCVCLSQMDGEDESNATAGNGNAPLQDNDHSGIAVQETLDSSASTSTATNSEMDCGSGEAKQDTEEFLDAHEELLENRNEAPT